MKNKKSLLIYIVFGLIISAQYFGFQHFNQGLTALSESISSIQPVVPEQLEQYDDSSITTQIQSINNSFKALNARLSDIEDLALSVADHNAELDHTMMQEEAVEAETVGEVAVDMPETIDEVEEVDPFEAKVIAHQNEVIDQDWTNDIHTNLSSSFISNPALKGGSIDHVDCRQSSCDILIISDADLDDGKKFSLEYELYAEMFKLGMPYGKVITERLPDGRMAWKMLYDKGTPL